MLRRCAPNKKQGPSPLPLREGAGGRGACTSVGWGRTQPPPPRPLPQGEGSLPARRSLRFHSGRVGRRPVPTRNDSGIRSISSQDKIALVRQVVVARLAAEHHRHDRQQRETGHERGRLGEISAERCREQSGDQGSEAGDHPPGAIAERHRGGAHMGGEQLRQIHRVAGEHAEHEEAENRQHVRIQCQSCRPRYRYSPATSVPTL